MHLAPTQMTAAHKPEMTSAAPGPAVVVTVATARDHDNIIIYLGDRGRRWGERHRGNRYHRHSCKGTRRKTDEQQASHKATPLIAYCVYKEMLRAQIKFPEALRQI